MPTYQRDPILTSTGMTERLVADVSNTLYYLRSPNEPLATIFGRVSQESTNQPQFFWDEQAEPVTVTQINNAAGYTSTDTQIKVDNSKYFPPGELVKIGRTGEVVRVSGSDDANNLIIVSRGFGGSTAAALLDNDYLFLLGNGVPEDSLSGEMRLIIQERLSNYTQIYRLPFGVSGTELAVKTYTGPELTRLRLLKMAEFKTKLEQDFLFGVKASTNIGGEVIRTTGGIYDRITSKVINLGATVTAGGFETAMESAFEYGDGEKLFVAGATLISLLNTVARNKLQTNEVASKRWGLRIMTWITPHGELNFVKHPLLRHTYATTGLVLDPKKIKIRPLQGNGENRNIQLRTNIQEKDRDGRRDEYFAELGFQLMNEPHHAIVKADLAATAAKDSGF